MKTTLLSIGLGAFLVLGVAVLVGRQRDPVQELRPPEAPRPRTQDGSAKTPDKRETAKLPNGGADTIALTRRVEKLEERVVELRARKEELVRVKEGLDRELKEKGAAVKFVESPEMKKRRWDMKHFSGPADIADFLGLDAGRRDALVAACEDARNRAKLLEASLAVVNVDGELTTIDIPAFENEGNTIAAELVRRVEAILTPQERDKYLATQPDAVERYVQSLSADEKEKYQATRLCLTPLAGQPQVMSYPPAYARQRRISIRETGNQIKLDVVSLNSDGKEGGRSSTTLQKTDRMDVLADYRHLLH